MSKLTVEQVARVCHEANRAYCASIGDLSQPSWDDAPDWQRESAKNGVRFHRENPLANPIDSHENWLREKVENGWVCGSVKDPEKKEHPCMVPYHELPVEQRRKDSLFIAVVRALDGGH
jgi:hypothetical protein